MIEELRDNIDKLSNSEAKSVLLQMILRLQVVLESKESQEEKLNEVENLYNEMVHLSQAKDKYEGMQEHQTIHLVCGESPAGALRYSLGSHQNKIIGFPDFFAEGPLKNLHNEEGFRKRHQWLMEHINMEMDYLEDEYENRFRKAVEQIKNSPENLPIIIWTSENVNEQIGLRYFLYLLQNHDNEIYVINTTLAYKELMDTDEIQYFIFHTGEAHPDQISAMNEQKRSKPLTIEVRHMYQNEWVELSKTDGVLRIWKENKVQTVSEDYFDSQIIHTAKNLHSQQEQVGFMKSGRIIGDLLGHVAGQIGDAFLEYRIRCLVYKGVFEIKGVPKGMRYYSVRLKDKE
ncbi:DUF1835 domain-containing protein [Halalkalibacter akibai]|uniref:DUF1835 domain-containing protein n=1 Tax=Halalkalibacter akibai (strain ATCC 43226 / DSM 21942 / CIP 109018 / JCM 9157 / 1139) TaxID=1236973 RepID=W4QZV0_HALA3|nr:DUF1835 domain-containing protein [Halalkalibacter akibai]GAE37611.1 hypothetical protein JCM9157_4928 [Halalkalibacter akibai JCM 9157]